MCCMLPAFFACSVWLANDKCISECEILFPFRGSTLV